MNIKTLSTLFTSLALLAVSSANAKPLEFDFTGTIVADPFGLLTNDLSFSGKYFVDDGAVNLSSDPQVGIYQGFGAFEATVGGLSYAVNDNTIIGVAHDSIDQYTPTANDGLLTLQLFLQANGGNVLQNVALPTTAPALAAFDIAQFRLFGSGAVFIGQLETLTCEACGAVAVASPPTLALVAIGMVAIVGVRRRFALSRALRDLSSGEVS